MVVSVSDVGAVVAVRDDSSALARLCGRLRRFLVGAASTLGGGGCTAAAVASAARALAARDSDSISSGRLGSAWEGLGAGPIAAPAATPIASIAAASAAVARAGGARKGDFGFSGRLFIEWSGIDVNRSKVQTTRVPDLAHKIANIDQICGDMLCSALLVVNSLSIRSRNGASLQCIQSAVSPSPSRWLACSGLRRPRPPTPPRWSPSAARRRPIRSCRCSRPSTSSCTRTRSGSGSRRAARPSASMTSKAAPTRSPTSRRNRTAPTRVLTSTRSPSTRSAWSRTSPTP